MGQVQVGTVVPALPLQLVLHVGYDVVLFGVDRHDAAVLAHFLENLPQVPHGDASVEGRENLEAGHARLNRLANLPHGAGRDCPGENVVEGVVGVGVTPENVPPGFNLAHNRVGRRDCARRQGQRASEVHVGRHAAEGRGAAGRLGRLGVDTGVAPGPVVGHGNVDVGVGFDAAGQHYHSGSVDGLRRAHVVESAGRGHGRDLLPHDSDVHERRALGRNHCPAFDNQVKHDCLPIRRFRRTAGDLTLGRVSLSLRPG